MDKFEFINIVKDILEETDNELLLHKGQEMKNIIDIFVKQEREYAKIGIR